MTNSEHNDKKRDASMVTNTSQHFDNKTGRCAQARLIPLKNLQWTFLTMKSLSELALKSSYKI